MFTVAQSAHCRAVGTNCDHARFSVVAVRVKPVFARHRIELGIGVYVPFLRLETVAYLRNAVFDIRETYLFSVVRVLQISRRVYIHCIRIPFAAYVKYVAVKSYHSICFPFYSIRIKHGRSPAVTVCPPEYTFPSEMLFQFAPAGNTTR